jgi:hypothetical protein
MTKDQLRQLAGIPTGNNSVGRQSLVKLAEETHPNSFKIAAHMDGEISPSMVFRFARWQNVLPIESTFLDGGNIEIVPVNGIEVTAEMKRNLQLAWYQYAGGSINDVVERHPDGRE